MKKIVFISGHVFGHEALQGLLFSEGYLKNKLCITRLITLKENKKDKTVGYTDFKKIAIVNNLDYMEILSSNANNFYNLVYEVAPDFIMCIGWSRLLKSDILDIPRMKYQGTRRHTDEYGCIGMHPTLLPIGRGRAPIPWTIIYGLSKTGLTTFFLEEKADSGDIILQTPFQINKQDSSNTLFDTFTKLHMLHGNKISDLIVANKVKQVSTPQEEKLASVWSKRTPEDSLINFNMKGNDIIKHCKAMTPPYPSAFIHLNHKIIRIKDAEFIPKQHKLISGTIIESDIKKKRIRIVVIDGYIDFYFN